MRAINSAVFFCLILSGGVVAQGIAVFDLQNVTHSITTARTTIDQLNEFRRFAQQQTAAFELLKQNSKQLSAAEVQLALNSLQQLLEAGERGRRVLEETKRYDRYVSSEDNSTAYELGRCYSTGCSQEEWRRAKESADRANSAERERINAEMLDVLSKEQEDLARQAQALDALQRSAENVDGQLEALMMANRHAALQTQHLQKIQGLLMLQGNAAAQREASELARQRRKRAAEEKAMRYTPGKLIERSPVQIIDRGLSTPTSIQRPAELDQGPRAPSTARDEL